MTFAQRRNPLTTHFSERVSVVKRRISVAAESSYGTRGRIAASQSGRQCPSTCVTFPVMLVLNSERFFPTGPQAGEPPLVDPSATSCSRYPHAVGTVGLLNKQNNEICNMFETLMIFWNPYDFLKPLWFLKPLRFFKTFMIFWNPHDFWNPYDFFETLLLRVNCYCEIN
jgi:hypothetical protein